VNNSTDKYDIIAYWEINMDGIVNGDDQIKVGRHDAGFDIILYDDLGNDISDRFYINKKFGVLSIYSKKIILKPTDLTTYMDEMEGDEFTFPQNEYAMPDNGLLEIYVENDDGDLEATALDAGDVIGHLENGVFVPGVKVEGSVQYCGEAESKIDMTNVYVYNNGTDVTYKYLIDYRHGMLTIDE
jgi:hypothetical protein